MSKRKLAFAVAFTVLILSDIRQELPSYPRHYSSDLGLRFHEIFLTDSESLFWYPSPIWAIVVRFSLQTGSRLFRRVSNCRIDWITSHHIDLRFVVFLTILWSTMILLRPILRPKGQRVLFKTSVGNFFIRVLVIITSWLASRGHANPGGSYFNPSFK